ncbi:MAG: NAD(P)-dependent oxidoreductase [Bacteroidota bacterium]|jgi:nucleoside-diphosphate-sugar epimerase
MKVLITGATGFIGSHLTERLRRGGNEVLCVAKDRMNIVFLESLNANVVLADLNNGVDWERMLDGVDYIYHLAGLTRAQWSSEYYRENHLATKRFVEVCANRCSSLKRFVYVSSQTAAGPSLDGYPVTEKSPYHPVSHYGKSKMLAELEVLKQQDRLPVTIVRPTAVYGPRERDWYEYFKSIRRGIQPVIGFRPKLMSLIHATDLVDGIILAGEHPSAIGETYFLGNQEFYTTRAIGDAIANAMCCNPFIVRLPHGVVYAVGAIAEAAAKISGKQIFFNLQKVREAVQTAWVCSVEKATHDIGFQPRIPINEGMLSTYKWYLENGWL